VTDDEALPMDRPSWVRRHWHECVAVVVTVLLRLPSVFNGLPYVNHPDEPVNYDYFHRMVVLTTVKPGFYVYPSLQYDIQAGVHWAVGHAGKWFGEWQSMADLGYVPGRADGATLVMQSEPWVAARLVTLVITCVGVVAAVRLATRLTRSSWWGLAAGLLGAVSVIGITNGATITPDALAGTTAILALVWMLRLHEPVDAAPDRRWTVMMGVLLGLAVGSKYNNAVLFFALGGAVWLLPQPRRPSIRQLFALTAVSAGVFLLTTPGVFLDTSRFFHDIGSLLDHYASGHPGAEGNALAAQARYLWRSEAIAVVGTVAALVWSRRRRPVIVLAGWVIGYILLLGLPQVHFARNLTPVLGAMTVLAAVGGQQLWWRLRAMVVRSGRTEPRTVVAVVLLTAALVAGVTTQLWSVQFEVRRDLTDHQAAARHWLEDTVPVDAVVVAEAYSPWLDRTVWTITNIRSLPLADEEVLAGADIIIRTSSASGRFDGRADRYPGEVAIVEGLRNGACDIRRYEDQWGYWVEVLFQRCD